MFLWIYGILTIQTLLSLISCWFLAQSYYRYRYRYNKIGVNGGIGSFMLVINLLLLWWFGFWNSVLIFILFVGIIFPVVSFQYNKKIKKSKQIIIFIFSVIQILYISWEYYRLHKNLESFENSNETSKRFGNLVLVKPAESDISDRRRTSLITDIPSDASHSIHSIHSVDEQKQPKDFTSRLNYDKSMKLVSGYIPKKLGKEVVPIIHDYLSEFWGHKVGGDKQKQLISNWIQKWKSINLEKFDEMKQELEKLSYCNHEKTISIDPQNEFIKDNIEDENINDALLSKCDRCGIMVVIDSVACHKNQDFSLMATAKGVDIDTEILKILPYDWLRHSIIEKSLEVFPQTCNAHPGKTLIEIDADNLEENTWELYQREQGAETLLIIKLFCDECAYIGNFKYSIDEQNKKLILEDQKEQFNVVPFA